MTDGRRWNNLPTTVIELSLSLLSPRELCAASQVCRAFAKASREPRVTQTWARLLQKAYPGLQEQALTGEGVEVEGVRYGANAPPHRLFLARRNELVKNHKQNYEDGKAATRRKKCFCLLRCCETLVILPMMACLFIIGLATLAVSLAVYQTIYLWALAPFIAIFVCFCLVSMGVCYVSAGPLFEWPFGDAQSYQFDGFPSHVVRTVLREDDKQLVLYAFLYALLLAFITLFCLKVSGYVVFSYYYVFIPAWALFGCLCCMPCFPAMLDWQDDWDDRFFMSAIPWCSFLVYVCVFTILLAFKLERGLTVVPMRMVYVFVPLLVMAALWLIFALVMIRETVLIPIGYCFCLAPPLTFIALCILHFDNRLALSYPVLVTPLLVWGCCCLAATCFFSKELYSDGDHDPRLLLEDPPPYDPVGDPV